MVRSRAALLLALAVVTPAAAQDQTRSAPYTLVDVDFRVAGTLALPDAELPAPAVIIVRGPGPQQRDDEPIATGPFQQLAERLVRLGHAVLQVDLSRPDRNPHTATTRDFARDVRDAVVFLGTHRRVAPDRIGLVGHGEGATIAAMAAAAGDEVAFAVLLAGAGVRGDELLGQQFALAARAAGASDAAIARERGLRQRVYDQVISERDGLPNIAQRRALVEELTNEVQSKEEKDRVSLLLTSLLKTTSSPWFRFFLAHDPATDLERLRMPVLAVTGEHDVLVPPRENAPAVRAALEKSGNRDVTVSILGGLDHLLADADASDAERATMNARALEVIANWIATRTSTVESPD
jgi:hypothetical protein